MTEDKIYFSGFTKGGETITVANGVILVGGTEHVEIHNDAGTADNDKATEIKDDSTKYRFVADTFNEKARIYTFTDN